LAEVSGNIIDQCVAQGVPFAREYSGYLDNRSFGGSQLSRTFYARGQTGQQLLLGAYGALMKEVGKGNVTLHPRCEMLDLVTMDGQAKGITVRNLLNGKVECHAADVVILATGGYGNVYYLSTNAMNSNVTAAWRCHKKGALFANPCYTQIHPTCIPVHGSYQSKLTLMSESLRNDGRVWVPKAKDDKRHPNQIPESERNYYLETKYPSFGNLVPRDVASRNAKTVCDEGLGVGSTKLAVYLDFKDAINRLGEKVVKEKYSNLFEMYDRIADASPYKEPMMIYPAIHYTMGGLWVDYNLESTVKGLFVLGEANFSDHGANRLGASALMQGLADGYFVAPYTVSNFLAENKAKTIGTDHPLFEDSIREVNDKTNKLITTKGKKTVDEIHKELGLVMWDKCGMSRTDAGLKEALAKIPAIRDEFHNNVTVSGASDDFNQTLEKAGRVSDFLEFGELLAYDALQRTESCGGHFREESQTPDGEAQRKDEEFSHVSAWGFEGVGKTPTLSKEPLTFEYCKPSQRSYK
jgi:succinate dehydrogenase / fumarate reductase flavoprotein subunit